MASKEKEEKNVVVPRSAAEVQRMKLEKLMKNPEKPVVIPDGPHSKLPRVFKPPEFVRNIWGSSAGAGSGDFHVYRGIRRREYARQKFANEQSVEDELDEKHRINVETKHKIQEEKSAKKRAKRQKKKMKQKAKKTKPNQEKPEEESESEDEDDDSEEDVENKNAENGDEKDNSECKDSEEMKATGLESRENGAPKT